jgi:hypothetical protein
MDMDAVPAGLQERLGADATHGLLELLDLAQREARAEVIAACTERFERRLVEEIAGVRVQIAQVDASLRQEITETRASLRQEIAETSAALRLDLASGRVELLKWCFLFWMGQVFAVAGIMGVMLRISRP